MDRTGDRCPICGEGVLEKTVLEENFEYKGQSLTVPDYIVYNCPNCDEDIVDKNTSRDTEKIIRDFHRKTDGLLTSKEIRKIRKSFGFTQVAMGELLGGGEKSFARYENGQITQSKAMDNLLRVLDADPSILDIITGHSQKEMEQKATEGMIYKLPRSTTPYKISRDAMTNRYDFSFGDYHIVRVEFSKNQNFDSSLEQIEINPAIAIDSEQEKKIVRVYIAVDINDKEMPFSLGITGEGIFTFKEPVNPGKSLDGIVNINCAAIMFPFIRESIADLTRKAGYPPLLLPPMNFVNLYNESKKKKTSDTPTADNKTKK